MDVSVQDDTPQTEDNPEEPECRRNDDCNSGNFCTVHEITLECDPDNSNPSKCPVGKCQAYSDACQTSNECKPDQYCTVDGFMDDISPGECKDLGDEGERCGFNQAINWGKHCKPGLRCVPHPQGDGLSGTCGKEEGIIGPIVGTGSELEVPGQIEIELWCPIVDCRKPKAAKLCPRFCPGDSSFASNTSRALIGIGDGVTGSNYSDTYADYYK
jgi:hypothetical protein